MRSVKLSSLIPIRPSSLASTKSSSMFGATVIEADIEALGVELTRLQLDLPWPLSRVIRQARQSAITTKQVELLSGHANSRYSVGRKLPSDNFLLAWYAAEVEPPKRGLWATFEDMTVAQAIRHGVFGYGELSRGQAEVAYSRQKRWYQGATACFAQTQWMADSVINDYGVDPESVVVVGQACRELKASVDGQARDWTVPKFLFAGLDWERKNGNRVLEGFRAVRAAHPNAELHLVGRVPDVDEPGVTSHGFLDHSNVKDKLAWSHLLSTCTCFVLPSLFDPGGTAHAEAVSSGLPAIGTKIGGNREVIGDAGILVTPTDQREICEAMVQMCDPDVAQRLGSLGPHSTGIATSANIALTIRDALNERLLSVA